MTTPDRDDFAELEADLRALAPRATSAGFPDRVDTETTLRALRPRRPSPGFARRVAAACGVAEARLVRFPLARLALGAAAAAAVVMLASRSGPAVAPPPPGRMPVARLAAAPARPATGAAYARADDGTILPVINLGDGRVYRPTLRRRADAPGGSRPAPEAGILPAAYGAGGATLEYSPIEYE